MTTYRPRFGLLCVCLVVVSISCSGDHFTKPSQTLGTGEITGRIVPMEEGVTVTINDGRNTASVDPDGSFRFADLETGAYTLVIESPSYSTRRIHDVVVRENVTVVMGDVPLSLYPAPFFKSIPASGTTGIGLDDRRFTFYSDEALDQDRLQSATTIEPPVEFSWALVFNQRVGWSYSYNLVIYYGELKVGTEYTLTVDRTLFTESGTQLDHDLVMTFTTGPLDISLAADEGDLAGLVPLADAELRLAINGKANPDSLNKAVTFEPSLPGEWRYVTTSGYHYHYRFYIDGYIGADAGYTMNLDPSVALVDTLRPQAPITLQFHTEPRRVVSVFPGDGTELIQPVSMWYITVSFNLLVDTTSVVSGFRVATANGADVPGRLGWAGNYTIIGLGPTVPPATGETYRIYVGPDLRFADGGSLPEPFVSEFYIK